MIDLKDNVSQGDLPTEVYLLLLQVMFKNANKYFQRHRPLIHVLKSHLAQLIKDIMLKFVSSCQVPQSYQEGTLDSVNFFEPVIQVRDEKLFIGHTTRQKINKILDDQNISPHQYQSFSNCSTFHGHCLVISTKVVPH